ncbi:MAG: GAF domain-containing protein [Lactobacillales bacterium]|jgi:GAF domain-containing protein|nr:GAF domain-containing protein [Lactobacillales bacterium]
MTNLNKYDKLKNYELLLAQCAEVVKYEKHWVPALANISALLHDALGAPVFSGFYFFDGKELVLGPFQGKLSCTRIALGRGVCGESAEKRETIVVDDVYDIDNYISCDAEAVSEIVVPIVQNDTLVGVIDLDSSVEGNYDEVDVRHLEKLAQIIADNVEF